MTTKKGIVSKAIEGEKEEDEMLLSPKLYDYAVKVKIKLAKNDPNRVDWGEQVISIPANEEEYEH